MDEAGEVQAYSSAAAQAYLSTIDESFVEHALRVVANMRAASVAGTVLDIGTGPGQIVLKLAAQLPGWMIVAVDRAPNPRRFSHQASHGCCAASSAGLAARLNPGTAAGSYIAL